MKEMLVFLGALLLCMSANVLFGVAIANLTQSFDKDTFIKGIKKALVIALGLVCLYCGGYLMPTLSVISIDGNNLTILQAMNYGFIGGIVLYGAKAIKNLFALIGLDTQIDAPNDVDNEELPTQTELESENEEI